LSFFEKYGKKYEDFKEKIFLFYFGTNFYNIQDVEIFINDITKDDFSREVLGLIFYTNCKKEALGVSNNKF
jgi:hypothetical protein